jgi:hypothetical protein
MVDGSKCPIRAGIAGVEAVNVILRIRLIRGSLFFRNANNHESHESKDGRFVRTESNKSRSCSMNPLPNAIRTALCAAIVAVFVSEPVRAGTFILPATTSDQAKLDLGFFPGNTIITIEMTGVISLTGSSSLTWSTNPDGSVVGAVAAPYDYANPGATDYPTFAGGDGINHFLGGGANTADGNFPFAGALSTDTTDPGDIRLGDVVGTFSASPTRSDWFSIGIADSVLTPVGGSNLYVAVVDTYYPNNTGSYDGTFSTASVPEPASFLVFAGLGAVMGLGAMRRGQRRKRPSKQATGCGWSPDRATAADRRSPKLRETFSRLPRRGLETRAEQS